MLNWRWKLSYSKWGMGDFLRTIIVGTLSRGEKNIIRVIYEDYLSIIGNLLPRLCSRWYRILARVTWIQLSQQFSLMRKLLFLKVRWLFIISYWQQKYRCAKSNCPIWRLQWGWACHHEETYTLYEDYLALSLNWVNYFGTSGNKFFQSTTVQQWAEGKMLTTPWQSI